MRDDKTGEVKHHSLEDLLVIISSFIPIFRKKGNKVQCRKNKTEIMIIEPRHDKTNIMGLRPAWIKTSLRIRAV
jgi:hypothetical protein